MKNVSSYQKFLDKRLGTLRLEKKHWRKEAPEGYMQNDIKLKTQKKLNIYIDACSRHVLDRSMICSKVALFERKQS
jgi:hypothetical protein